MGKAGLRHLMGSAPFRALQGFSGDQQHRRKTVHIQIALHFFYFWHHFHSAYSLTSPRKGVTSLRPVRADTGSSPCSFFLFCGNWSVTRIYCSPCHNWFHFILNPSQLDFIISVISLVTGQLTQVRQKSMKCRISVHVSLNDLLFSCSWDILWIIPFIWVHPLGLSACHHEWVHARNRDVMVAQSPFLPSSVPPQNHSSHTRLSGSFTCNSPSHRPQTQATQTYIIVHPVVDAVMCLSDTPVQLNLLCPTAQCLFCLPQIPALWINLSWKEMLCSGLCTLP